MSPLSLKPHHRAQQLALHHNRMPHCGKPQRWYIQLFIIIHASVIYTRGHRICVLRYCFSFKTNPHGRVGPVKCVTLGHSQW
jgi:hypothetical protein